jgi:hypothetical protein
MPAAALRSLLLCRSDWQARLAPSIVPSGVPELDASIGGLPQGCLTEIFGPASSGRMALLVSILAQATARGEACALVDADDAFDPVSAPGLGVDLERLLWVRCNHNAEHALKATDLLIHGGGFGVVAMDLGDMPEKIARRIPLAAWFRLRRAVEHTPTVFVALSRQANAKTCASLLLECARTQTEWGGARGVSRLLRGMSIAVAPRRPSGRGAAHVCLPVR